MSGSEHPRVVSAPVEDLEALERQWVALQRRAECSYFQSWGWIGTWLREVVADLAPQVMRVYSGQQLVGLGIFVERDFRRRHLFRVRAAYLNDAPFAGRNMVVEYNGLLVAPGHERAVYREAVQHLFAQDRRLDELWLDAIPEPVPLEAPPGGGLELRTEETSLSWQIDLDALEPGLDGYLATLSRNRRGQIRRSLKAYAGDGGPLRIHEARSAAEALAFMERLEDLHTRHWHAQGLGGAFANPVWERFHRALIQNRFPAGEVQLLKIDSGNAVVGFLYNLVWRGRVYVVQTGFEQPADARFMPGYVSHALAVAHNRGKGMKVYDLMHGDAQYKRILCNRSERLVWRVLRRRRRKFRLEDALVGAVRTMRSRQKER